MKNKATSTVVYYWRDSDKQVVSHTWREILSRQQVEQRIVMQLHINRSAIQEIDYQ
jgi:acyl-CoA synthetase (AMP-forming)/AMP-acid ligase II